MQEPDRSFIEKIVFLKTDPEKLPRMITGYKVNKYDVIFELTCGTQTTNHYDFEFTDDLNKIEVKGFGN